MTEEPVHPSLLSWCLSGDLDPDRTRETEAHLAACPECRAELISVASMLRVVNHENLMAASGGPASGPGPRRWPRAEARSSHAAGRPAAAISRPRVLVWSAGAALLALLVPAMLVWRGSWSAPAPDRPPREVRAVTFPPPARGIGGERILPGSGPWSVAVVMPFGAPPGAYRVRIEHDGSARAPLETTAGTSPEGTLALVIDSLEGPGRYTMAIEPETGTTGVGYRYPFEVVPPPAPASPR